MDNKITSNPTTESEATTRPVPASMTAAVQHRYGSSEVVDLERIAVPRPGPRQVVVQVAASGIDRGVVHLMTGTPTSPVASWRSAPMWTAFVSATR